MRVLFMFLMLGCAWQLRAQSRKQLLEECRQWELRQARWQQDSLRQASEIALLNQEISDLDARYNICELSRQELQADIDYCLNQLKKRVEVYDLYSFGYQPLKTSVREYEALFAATRQAIETSRWKNVEQLGLMLGSKKLSEEDKTALTQAFGNIYPELRPLVWRDLVRPDAALQQSIKNAIAAHTQTELQAMRLENLWIQALEMHSQALELLKK